MTRLAFGSATDVGRVRQMNQDSVLCRDDLVVVADGMGGHRGGEVASAVAIETLDTRRDELVSTDDYVALINEANRAILDRSREDADLAGMGTTVVAIGLIAVDADPPERLVVANVGDSRGYVVREGELRQITEDHNLVESLRREGRISAEEAEHHPNRNILTRALGIDDEVLVDIWELEPVVGDRYLLCSDGLFNEVPDSQIDATLRRLADPDEAAGELVRLALEGGGRDNVSVIVADVVDDASPVSGVGTVERAEHTEGSSEPSVWRAGDDDADSGDGDVDGRSRLFTWRVALFVALLVAIIVAGVVALGVYARGGYFVAFDDDATVVVYRGRPDGVLWFEPTVETRTDLVRGELSESAVRDVDATHELASRAEAERFVAALEQ